MHTHSHPGHSPHRHAHGVVHHDHARSRDRRRLVATLVLTLIIFAAELGGGWYAHSLALLSDAGHMLSDVAAQILSLVALALAVRPADARRSYGYYRIEILAALGNGVALILLSLWIFWQGYHRLRGGVPDIHVEAMTVIAGVGLAANLLGVWLLHGARSLNVRGAYLHLLSDTLSSLAVLSGGVVMSLRPHWLFLDPLLSIGIALFIVYTAVRLVREAVDVLLEAVPLDVDLQGVHAALAAVQGVVAVHDLHIWTITSGLRALSAHLVVDDSSGVHSDRLLGEINQLLAERFHITHSTLQVETGGYGDPGHPCVGCLPLEPHQAHNA